MNAKRITLIVTLLVATFGAARAESPTPDPYTNGVSTRTRAEVVAEVKAAIADGSIAALRGEDSGSIQTALLQPSGAPTRAEVRAQLLATRADGSFGLFAGEDSGSFHMARQWQAGRAGRVDVRMIGMAR